VVIDGVLTEEECARSQQEVWAFLSKRGVDATDSSTWENENWPKEVCRNGGFMGKFPYFNKLKSLDALDIPSQDQAWVNRQNPLIYQSFAIVLDTPKLWVSIDRYGVMRPTTLSADLTKDVKPLIKHDWKTKSDWLHWDLSPFHYGTSAAGFGPNMNISNQQLRDDYGHTRVQGLVTLVDCPIEVGGFHCIPKFQDDRFFNWGKQNEAYGNSQVSKTALLSHFLLPPDLC